MKIHRAALLLFLMAPFLLLFSSLQLPRNPRGSQALAGVPSHSHPFAVACTSHTRLNGMLSSAPPQRRHEFCDGRGLFVEWLFDHSPFSVPLVAKDDTTCTVVQHITAGRVSNVIDDCLCLRLCPSLPLISSMEPHTGHHSLHGMDDNL